MKYKEPQEFFKYLIEEFGYSVFKDTRKCLAIASDMFDWNKQTEFLFKTAVNNKVYETLLKGKDSTSENKLICIENAVKILTDDCCVDTEKATTVVGFCCSYCY